MLNAYGKFSWQFEDSSFISGLSSSANKSISPQQLIWTTYEEVAKHHDMQSFLAVHLRH